MSEKMESENASASTMVTTNLWFEGLRQTVLSCCPQTQMEMECSGLDSDERSDSNSISWTISSTLSILTSEATKPRQILVEYICNTNGVQPLFNFIEYAAIFRVGEKTTKILRELISSKSGKQRSSIIKQCVEINYLPISVSVLKQLLKTNGSNVASVSASSPSLIVSGVESSISSEGTERDNISIFAFGIDSSSDLGCNMATTMDLIWLLSTLMAKDSKSADKIRQMLKVKFFHDVFKKLFFAKSNLHFPLLKILKIVSKCRRSEDILGKDKVMATVKKCFALLNTQPNVKLLALMDWLALLIRDRKNGIRFLKAGLLVKVVNCFRYWSHWRGKGLLKLSKAVISIYTHLARTKSGKRALLQSDAVNVIQAFCEQCPSERSFDDVMARACSMIYICSGKDNLPLENLECPIKFEVPQTTGADVPLFVIDSGSSSDEDDPDEGEESEIVEDCDEVNNDNDSESDNEDVCDEDGDDIDEHGNHQETDGLPQYKSSRKNSQVLPVEQGDGERNILDKIANYSCFFREFSSMYSPKEEMGNTLTPFISKRKCDDDGDSVDVENIYNNGPHLHSLSVACFPTSVHKYSWTSRHGTKLPRMENLRKQYFQMANEIRHVSPFVKIAYPDICFGLSGKQVESLCANTDRSLLRKNVLTCIARAMYEHPGFRQKVVYSLDELVAKYHSPTGGGGEGGSKEVNMTLENTDEKEIAKYDPKLPLSFESRFESGNLRKAIQIGEYEYDLLLTSDINSSRHNQWFYFQVGNVTDESPYVFNIINCLKTNSLFNYGMQPMVFSVMDAMKNRPGWIRSGTAICYYRNGYKCIGKKSVKTYHTLSFSLKFPNKGDIVYIAYYIPYTYTRLMIEIDNLMEIVPHSSEKVHCRYDVLCKSLDGNDIPLITITAPLNGNNSLMQNREVVFITSRVHPGETNASWVMMGILRKLMFGSQVEDLLQKYVFKIVPMLNVEGVVNGCHRSGLTSQDLNRCWKNPHELLHSSIYNTKMLIAYCCKIRGRQPALYLDLHGHSRRKNAFFYGCSFARSWKQEDRTTPENPQKLYALAESMSIQCPYFVMHFCHYDVRKSRETTARVAVWRDFGITCSYTLECSYCGCDRGPCKGITFGSGQLWDIGEGVCDAIANWKNPPSPVNSAENINIGRH